MTKTDAIEFAERMDRDDPLAGFRERFAIPTGPDGSPCIYFCGNSLGLQPDGVRDAVNRELDDWAALGVEGHFKARHPWMPYHERVAGSLARLVGASPAEVVAMNTLTVNLHLMMVSFYRPTAERHKILIEAHAFPSDQYAVQSQLRYHGYDPAEALVELPPRAGGVTHRTDDILDLLDREGKSIALVLLGGVNYYSGQVFDMGAIAAAARAAGCVVGYDLAHAVGNVPLRLHDWGVDFAVWCTYKYLNAGPGNLAGCFVHERHARAVDLPRFAGWWGHDPETRFRMGPGFDPAPGAAGWQLSNPPILPLAALRASLDVFDAAGMDALRAKSERLTGFLGEILAARFAERVRVITPAEPEARGCQLSLVIGTEGRKVFEGLTRAGVIADWREPDVIRVAPAPLYNTFGEVARFCELLDAALEGR